jgi:hypothetical protein
MAPDVVLEIDHINPVKRGGKNDILNLVTSCLDCNRGKGQKTLTDNQIIKQQQELLKDLNEKREQLKMMLVWKKELESFENEQVSAVEKMLFTATKDCLSEYGRNSIKKAIKKYGLEEVIESTKISISQYNNGTEDGIEKTFAYIPRICANRKNELDNPHIYQAKYIMGILRNRFGYTAPRSKINDISSAIKNNMIFEMIKSMACTSKNWSEFWNWFNELFM